MLATPPRTPPASWPPPAARWSRADLCRCRGRRGRARRHRRRLLPRAPDRHRRRLRRARGRDRGALRRAAKEAGVGQLVYLGRARRRRGLPAPALPPRHRAGAARARPAADVLPRGDGRRRRQRVLRPRARHRDEASRRPRQALDAAADPADRGPRGDPLPAPGARGARQPAAARSRSAAPRR